ncbi:MAG TPA: xanthine dehydrogenase molybdopterin binding subunit [Lacipirellulaceae bacterium]|nr:xanthine dehydrogenase molybdopterin binding subunit [Lacipirellulaceae bacterium]
MPSVGKTIPHDSAVGHVTGQALYIDDMPRTAGELLVGSVGSPIAAGVLTGLDPSAALAVPGVVCVLTHADVPGHNLFGLLAVDEPFLADHDLLYIGQPIALVAAETPEALACGIAAVKIGVTEHEPLLRLEESIARQRFLGTARRISAGDCAAALAQAPHRLSGTLHIGPQEQFYLESQAALAYPAEDGQMVVHSSTQNPTEVQSVVAEMLGRGHHEVVCICKRMGGGFGGKESQASIPAMMAALVAHHARRPARVVYDKDTDMRITGKRHPYQARWDVGFDDAGRIHALRFEYYSNAGCSTDLSPSIMERTLLHSDNAYFIENADFVGRLCFTNIPSNTAFRGFGGPQAVASIENVVESIAQRLGVDALDVRRANLYGHAERNVTPYGQIVEKNHLPEIVEALAHSSDYQTRRAEINRHNAACGSARPRTTAPLRGLALTPMKFGISFTTKFLNQGNALVNLYTDGTIQVSTGGTEMGQGLNTKIRQLVADQFGLDPARVRVMPTSTEKNNNCSPTAASAGTDLNGAAAMNACQQIKRRLKRFAADRLADPAQGLTPSPRHVVFADNAVHDSRRPEIRLAFGPLCAAARRERVDLGARGFFATPGIDFNRETGRGTPFFYFTQGAAACEVEIDRFTGELTVTRADLLIDIGRSINPGVDRGQIIGGFIQGMGWVTAEALTYGPRGDLLSHSPTTYKIPAITDVPRDFRVALFQNNDNIHNIARSKAVGEPPLMLALSAWAAVKNALSYVSAEAAAALALPATGEEILRCLSLSRRAESSAPAAPAFSAAE